MVTNLGHRSAILLVVTRTHVCKRSCESKQPILHIYNTIYNTCSVSDLTSIFAPVSVSINLLITSSKMSKTTQLSVSKHLSLPLRLSPHTTLHIQNTQLETSTRSFLTITNPSTSGSLSCLGSYVYAMPNVSTPSFLVLRCMKS